MHALIIFLNYDILTLQGEHNMIYTINFTWDNEAAVWIAASDDIPGLVLESISFDTLIKHTRSAIPELLELNNIINTAVYTDLCSKI